MLHCYLKYFHKGFTKYRPAIIVNPNIGVVRKLVGGFRFKESQDLEASYFGFLEQLDSSSYKNKPLPVEV